MSAPPSNTHTEAYTYDHLNRLGAAVATGSGNTYNLTFATDRYGNMTCQTNGSTQGLCPNWAFDTTTNRINSSGFTYDPAGALATDGTHTYQWDAEGQMTAVDGGTTASYEYDALGRRVYANIEGGNEFWYFYDPAGNLVADWVPGGLGIDELMEPVAGRVLASYQNDREDVFLKHQNALGSWGLTTYPDGSVAQDELYYPWGQPWAAGSYVVELNFAGMGWHDTESNLDWTPARFYESRLGRWLSPDPAGGYVTNPQSLNRYAYALNNPTSMIDPSGLGTNSAISCDPFTNPSCDPTSCDPIVQNCNDICDPEDPMDCPSPPPPPPPGGGGGGGGTSSNPGLPGPSGSPGMPGVPGNADFGITCSSVSGQITCTINVTVNGNQGAWWVKLTPLLGAVAPWLLKPGNNGGMQAAQQAAQGFPKPNFPSVQQPIGTPNPAGSPSSLSDLDWWNQMGEYLDYMMHEAAAIAGHGVSFMVINSPCLYPQFQYLPMCGGPAGGAMY